ncbi:MAG: aminodeoxychorismate synthase component I [Gallionella sp.]|nr:aminodeoxychorismate synthase component I [Gallionella sp.]
MHSLSVINDEAKISLSFYSIDLPYTVEVARYYAVLRKFHWAVWLDSCALSRYDILCAAPHHSLVIDAQDVQAFELLKSELIEPVTPIKDVPFAGGVLGYWSYDLARSMEGVPELAVDAEQLPLMMVGVYDWALLVDHQQQRCRLVSHLRFPETRQLLDDIARVLKSPLMAVTTPFQVQSEVQSNFNSERYAQAYAQVQAYLQSGDCYQINLAQRFSATATGDAFAAYLHLREISPAPYAAFLDFPSVQILSASPERFLSVQDGAVETKPIKGTRPRGIDAESDSRYARELASHPKDRAENLMIVDLLRNDLGKSCEPGSVVVPKLFEVESYTNVHHLVSTVRGVLKKGCSALDVLRDCFPGGSITGAPKHRAMNIIEQLEPHRRGVYCGVIGYIGFDGNMDSNIAIRTLVYSHGEIRCWAGGGIVADSLCDAEYQETLDKASAMLALLVKFRG